MATKKAQNPGDQVMDFGALAQQLIQQAETIQRIAEGQALSEKAPDGKDVKPATDPAGQALATADILKTMYAGEMRVYTGLKAKVKDTIGADIRNAMAEARRHLTKAYQAYHAAVMLTREAMTNREAQAALWAEANAPKIVMQIERQDAAIERATKKRAELAAQQAAAQRGKRATA